jgi:predicted SAM-dependent methyltransferase
LKCVNNLFHNNGSATYVQYGCGFKAPREWTNFDSSATLKWEKIPIIGRLNNKNSQRFPLNARCGDIVKGLPVADRSCRGVYASHVLEHLALDDFHKALDNTRRILEPNGIFRLVVPDLEWAAREYVKRLEAGDPAANSFFLDETSLGRKERLRGLSELVYAWLETSAHKWMWDSLSLARTLEEHRFTGIRECSFGDCEDPVFALVEDPARFEHATAMEARA